MQGVVDQRLTEPPENWRLIYKTLLLLEYMCKRGPLVGPLGCMPLPENQALRRCLHAMPTTAAHVMRLMRC